ncbi:CDCA2 protein, partial [Serilophus lunatus]|nr:CDCA2 protein [Serilophus lunatus]
MHRQTRSPLKAKENRSGCAELKEEASFPPSKGKICRETKSKVIRAPKKENSSDGKPGKRALKCPKGLEGQLSHPEGDPGGWDVGTGSCKESFPSPLGSDLYLTPERHREEGKTALGTTEEWGKTPVDFAAVTIADFGITQESFATGWKGSSLALLKWRRRSTVGLHGSPESNSLIQYLTQQRRNRSRAPLPQISPFKHANVRSLKDKIEAFQTSFESLQEAEGETEQPGLSHGEGGSSQNKTFKKEQNLEQSEKFLLDNRGADLKENLSAKVTKSHGKRTHRCSNLCGCPGSVEMFVLKPSAFNCHVSQVSRPAPTPADPGSDALSDPGRRKVGFVGELSLGMLEDSKALVTPPVTPGRTNILFQDLSESGSLRSILKKTPRKQLLEDPEECSNDAVARGGGESVPDFNCAKIFEAPQTDNTESLTFKTPKKKKVTFGEDLSPEIFDQTLPANTPLHRGASPALQSCSPARPPPLPQLHLHWDQECLEPLQDFLEDSVAAEELPPVGNAEGNPSLNVMFSPQQLQIHVPPQHRALAEEEDCGSSGAEDTKNPRKTKTPRQRNVTASAPKKTPKTRRTGCGKRRKKKVKKSLYEERELASKKPLLSPIPEIPEVFSSASSPNSPGADAPFSEDAVPADPKSRNACKDVQEKALLEGMGGKNICAVDVYPRSASGPDQKVTDVFKAQNSHFSNVVPDTKGNFVTSEYFQQGEETAGEKEAKESGGSLIENKQLEGNVLIRLEFLDEGPQRVQCPQKDSGSGSPVRKRRRSSSAIYFPPVENLGVTGMDLPVLSYNVEEVLSVPRGPFQPLRRKSSTSGERRVRRSMRFSKEAGREGLAWIQLPSEIPEQPPKSRRRASTSILTGAGNAPPREQNLSPSSAPGKENEDSAGPCRRWRRRSLCAATPGETPEAQTHKRRSTNPANGKDRHKQTHSQEAKMPLERTFSEVSALSDFLK